jgi:hypothetical protein
MSFSNGSFTDSFQVAYAESHSQGGPITITVTAVDRANNRAAPVSTEITLDVCNPTPIIR